MASGGGSGPSLMPVKTVDFSSPMGALNTLTGGVSGNFQQGKGIKSLIPDPVAGLIGIGEGAAKGPPDPPAFGAPPPSPTQASASTTSTQKQLTAEQNHAATSTMLTSSQGLTDEPTTTGSLLTGN